MKLYDNTATNFRDLTLEQHLDIFRTLSVVSTEAISDYLFKVKDKLSNLYNKVLNDDIDTLALDALANKSELEHVSKRVKMSNLGVYTVNKPEGFRGFYLEYLENLATCALLASDNATNGVEQLKVSVGKLINDSVDNEVDMLFGRHLYKEIDKDTDYIQSTLAPYNKGGNDTRIEIKKLIRNLNDVPKMNAKVLELGGVINSINANEIQRKVGEAIEYIDALVAQESTNSILDTNKGIKKDLTEAIYSVSKAVEMYGFIYSSLLFYYKGHKNLSDEIIRVANLNE